MTAITSTETNPLFEKMKKQFWVEGRPIGDLMKEGTYRAQAAGASRKTTSSVPFRALLSKVAVFLIISVLAFSLAVCAAILTERVPVPFDSPEEEIHISSPVLPAGVGQNELYSFTSSLGSPADQ